MNTNFGDAAFFDMNLKHKSGLNNSKILSPKLFDNGSAGGPAEYPEFSFSKYFDNGTNDVNDGPNPQIL